MTASTPAPAAISETAYAKINLALHVRSRRADGYHEIESLFAFCEDGDALTGSLRNDGALALTLDGPFAAGLESDERNLVLRAARALRDAAGVGLGADLHLTKHLPVAAGIGGGSADAAAALRLLVRLWGINPAMIDFPRLAVSLGADVPACLSSMTVFGTGVGERLEPVDCDSADRPVLLVNPGVACPTGPVFSGWDGVDRGPLDPARWRAGRNDLTASAIALVPEIAQVLAGLEQQAGAALVRLSGSGATCFALFDDKAARDAARAAIRKAHPGWWMMASRLR
tara:strand:+ start:4903 stop:5757 length:855 start_codon:yes stop_codon:yes gene_type:complete